MHGTRKRTRARDSSVLPKKKGDRKLNNFGDDYTIESGTEEYPNQSARNEAIRIMRAQGFNQAFNRPVPPMSYFAYEAPGQQSAPSAIRYFVEYRGR